MEMNEIRTAATPAKDTTETLTLRKAILLYQGGRSSYATVNDIISGADGSPTIGPGVPATTESVGEIAKLLVENVKLGGYLPETVLSVGLSEVYWWMPPQKRRVYFKECRNEGIGVRSEVVLNPGLVFRVSASGWYVWAVKGKKRPTPDTEIFQAPYLNVYQDGSICVGSVITPQSASHDELIEWENSFFNSYFTHTNTSQLVEYKNGAYAWWKDMLDGKFKTFPEKVLLDTGKTLGTLLSGGGQ